MMTRLKQGVDRGLVRRCLLGLAVFGALAAPGARAMAQHAPSPKRGTQDDLRRQFDLAWKAADGPASLRELDAWCQKNRLTAERAQVVRVLAGLASPDRPASDQASREAARGRRAEGRKAVRDFLLGRARMAEAELTKLLGWMKAEHYAPREAKDRLARLARELELADQQGAGSISEIGALDHAPASPEVEQKLARDFSARVSACIKPLADKLFFAVDRCLAAGEAGLAFDLYQQLLRLDPDNERARRGLGQSRLGNRWLRPFEIEQAKAGLSWDERFGWIITRELSRYEGGEYFDLDARKWSRLADLNRVHAEAASPWKLRSEHFDLVSTADLEVSVQALARLEAFFLQAFRQYDLFFGGKGSATANSLVFGIAPVKKRLLVNLYRDQAQFAKEAKPPVAWAAGFYGSDRHASYFYCQGQTFNPGTLQHELTHQILGEYSGGGSPPAWLSEGAAVYLEDAFFRNGTLTLGTLENNVRLVAYRSALRAGTKEHSLQAVLRFVTMKDWDTGDIQANYRGVGAVYHFLMAFDGGRYRADTIAMLRDAYAGNSRPVEDYFGLSLASLDLLMARFYRDCESAAIHSPGLDR